MVGPGENKGRPFFGKRKRELLWKMSSLSSEYFTKLERYAKGVILFSVYLIYWHFLNIKIFYVYYRKFGKHRKMQGRNF